MQRYLDFCRVVILSGFIFFESPWFELVYRERRRGWIDGVAGFHVLMHMGLSTALAAIPLRASFAMICCDLYSINRYRKKIHKGSQSKFSGVRNEMDNGWKTPMGDLQATFQN